MLIEDREGLDALVREIRTAGRFALDTEFIREKTYRPRLCLLQVAAGEMCVAVDPFRFEDLSSLAELVLDPGVETIVHAGQQDFEIFYTMTGRCPRGVFDTQVAAALLGFGDSVGYSKLVESVLSVRLGRGEAFTDWARRPLSRRQIGYALDDVRHLHALRDRLGQELEERGRGDWVREEVAALEQEGTYRRDPSTLWRRVSGTRSMGRRELAIVRELAAWREAEAEDADRPRGRIISDGLIVEIARRAPTSTGDLGALRGLHPRQLRRHGERLLECVRKGGECPESELPSPPDRGGRGSQPTGIVDALELVIKIRSEEARVSPGYLATRGELSELLRARARGEEPSVPLLRGWRLDLVGREVLRFLDGDTRLGVATPSRGLAIFPRDSDGGS